MRLWTIQTTDVYNMIQENGVYHCRESLSFARDIEELTKAYNWISGQMEKRLGSAPNGVAYPVWAWHTWEFKHKRPDLRLMSFRVYEPSVLMEVEISDDRVLLTDEEKWNFILGNHYLNDAIDENTWEQKEAEYDALLPDEQEKIKLESWLDIFNIAPFENDFMSQGKWIQATFWELKKEDIVKVWPIKARSIKNG